MLVVNHALLLSDLSLRRQTDNYTTAAVLPPFERLIIDEAHHLEEVATRYFSTQVTRFGFARTLNRLRHPRKPQHGLLPRLITVLARDLPDREDTLFRDLHGRIEGLARRRPGLAGTFGDGTGSARGRAGGADRQADLPARRNSVNG